MAFASTELALRLGTRETDGEAYGRVHTKMNVEAMQSTLYMPLLALYVQSVAH